MLGPGRAGLGAPGRGTERPVLTGRLLGCAVRIQGPSPGQVAARPAEGVRRGVPPFWWTQEGFLKEGVWRAI